MRDGSDDALTAFMGDVRSSVARDVSRPRPDFGAVADRAQLVEGPRDSPLTVQDSEEEAVVIAFCGTPTGQGR